MSRCPRSLLHDGPTKILIGTQTWNALVTCAVVLTRGAVVAGPNNAAFHPHPESTVWILKDSRQNLTRALSGEELAEIDDKLLEQAVDLTEETRDETESSGAAGAGISNTTSPFSVQQRSSGRQDHQSQPGRAEHTTNDIGHEATREVTMAGTESG
ncbi:hypothetical protein F5H01DRAFT_381730 [Linnemannia elongata]|nr:hypothetical protein F5H01DRAFT_381730 [Linnemannia elongata]